MPPLHQGTYAIRSAQTEGEYPSHSQYIASHGACDKTRIVP
jgi:hypothetical protein